jgi:hypothetical protein
MSGPHTPRPTGGPVHPAHVRTAYEAALGQVSGTGPTPSLAQWEHLAHITTRYAATNEGIVRVLADIDVADTAGDFERAAVLRAAARAGRARAEAEQQIQELTGTTPTPSGPTTLGQRAIRQWSPAEPIWPKRQTVDETLATALLPPEHFPLARSAFRSVFTAAWRSCFYPDGPTGNIITPYTDEEGWRWRRYATDVAIRTLTGARAVHPADLGPGMVIYNGFGVRTVRSVTAAGTRHLARAGGAVHPMTVFQVRYTDGNTDQNMPADQALIRLLASEQGTTPPPPAPTTGLDFS